MVTMETWKRFLAQRLTSELVVLMESLCDRPLCKAEYVAFICHQEFTLSMGRTKKKKKITLLGL